MSTELESASRSQESLELSEFNLADLKTVERTAKIRCTTGHRSSAMWEGTPVSSLLDAVNLPPETTHLCFESDDGYRACLDVHTALESVLATARDGTLLESTERPRLVCPGVEGVRTVKGVAEIVPMSLSRNEDPEQFEALDLEEETDA